MAPIWPMRARALEARACSSRRPATAPVMSARAARTRRRPTSRTRPASSRAVRPRETVGLDRPLSRATWARETGPLRWIRSRMVRALIARSRLGVPTGSRSAKGVSPVIVRKPSSRPPIIDGGPGKSTPRREDEMAELALAGGAPVRPQGYPAWPVQDEGDAEAVAEVVRSGRWGGFPEPGPLAAAFAERFAA